MVIIRLNFCFWNSQFLKRFPVRISTEFPYSTKVFIAVKFSISTVMTMGWSCEGSMALKSASMNVINDILYFMWAISAFTNWTILRCFFCTVSEDPPLVNPPANVLITPRHSLIFFFWSLKGEVICVLVLPSVCSLRSLSMVWVRAVGLRWVISPISQGVIGVLTSISDESLEMSIAYKFFYLVL